MTVAVSRENANSHVRAKRTSVRLIDRIRDIARDLWPHKTALELAVRTGSSLRACEYWLAGRSGLTADALADLLRSDAGLAVLEGIIGDAKPVWWVSFKRHQQIAALRKAQEHQRLALEELERSAADR